jgi:hypothetical protein
MVHIYGKLRWDVKLWGTFEPLVRSVLRQPQTFHFNSRSGWHEAVIIGAKDRNIILWRVVALFISVDIFRMGAYMHDQCSDWPLLVDEVLFAIGCFAVLLSQHWSLWPLEKNITSSWFGCAGIAYVVWRVLTLVGPAWDQTRSHKGKCLWEGGFQLAPAGTSLKVSDNIIKLSSVV